MKDIIRTASFILFVTGALVLFASQRYGVAPALCNLVGSGLFLLTLVNDSVSFSKSQSTGRDYLKVVLAWKCSWILAAVLYFISHYIVLTHPQASTYLLLASVVFIILGGFVGFGIEIASLRPFAFDAQDAVSRKWRSSLSLGFIVLGLLGINYAAVKKDKSFDLTFLKASAAGEASKKIVDRLPHAVRVGVFFSQESEVLPLIREYFSSLPQDKLKFEYYDKDFNPMQSEEFRVARNGQIVLMDGDKRQRFEIGNRMDEARRNLKTLDSAFQKALLQLTSEPAAIYFTSTHGEMLWESGGPLRSIAAFEEIMRGQNFKTRRLIAMFNEVPADAKLLAIIGPTTSFTAQEAEALDRYIKKGGRILLALDIDKAEGDGGAVEVGVDELPKYLASLGLRYNRIPVAHDERFVTNSRQKSDRYFIFSNKFGKHPSVSTLNASSDRLTLMSFRTGSWDLEPSPSQAWTFTPTILSITGSFRDANGNFEGDSNEPRGNYPLVVAGETKDHAKLIAFADASIFSDTLMKVSGNQFATLDAVRWLTDRTEQAGAIESEEDVLIRHENNREVLIFHSSIYLFPLLVLAFGAFVNRRKKGRT
ncbi:MAG: Gldg family protein [Chitinophagaceae bacterium]|nr:Gldg family protein [Oligoflexus sp.]